MYDGIDMYVFEFHWKVYNYTIVAVNEYSLDQAWLSDFTELIKCMFWTTSTSFFKLRAFQCELDP